MKSILVLFCFMPEKYAGTEAIIAITQRYKLLTYNCQAVTAIFKRISDKSYHEQFSPEKLSDLTLMVPPLLEYEKVIEALMQYTAIFPVRFGTLFSSLAYLKKQMTEHHGVINDFLEKSFMHTEWAIKMYLKTSQAIDYFSAKASSSTVSSSEGTHYLIKQRMCYTLQQQLSTYLQPVYEEILEKLCKCASAVQHRETLTNSAVEDNLPMVNNWAFLVKTSHIAPFRRLFDNLNEQYAPYGLSCKLTGPWPPYSFCRLKETP